MERLPNPPGSLPKVRAHDLKRLEAGTRVWRIYFRGAEHPATWNTLRYFGPTNARFDHHTEPERVQKRGISYAAYGPRAIMTVLAEVFQETRLIDRFRAEPWVVCYELARTVTLLNVGSRWTVRAGGNMAIVAGSRRRAREWSRAIYRACPDLDGIGYPSSITNEPCIALYERAGDSIPTAPVFHDALASLRLFAGLTHLADQIAYDLR